MEEYQPRKAEVIYMAMASPTSGNAMKYWSLSYNIEED